VQFKDAKALLDMPADK